MNYQINVNRTITTRVVVDADSKKSAEEMYDILLADGTISRLESEQGEDTFTEVFVTEEAVFPKRSLGQNSEGEWEITTIGDMPTPPKDYKAMYDELTASFEQYKRESVKWSVEDFLWMEVDGYTITREQAQEGLEAMIDNHDASHGIGWHTLDYFYQEYGSKKPTEWRDNDAVEGREYARACSITGEGMNEGWVVSGGETYIKYEEDAIAFCRDEYNQTMEEAYAESEESDDDLFYWTNWESDDYQYIYLNGILEDKADYHG